MLKMETISENVKQKLELAIEEWAYEILPGRPSLLANAVYFRLLTELQKQTDEITEKFPV